MYDLSVLSKYRTQLMGFAILWITFYHMSLVFYIPIISEIKWLGYAGVEIFFMVSGIGLFFSWQQNPSTISFYKKRLLRIFPTHILIAIIFTSIAIYLYKYEISYLFYSITTLGFWVGKGDTLTSPWFISAIVFLYILTPVFLKYFQKRIITASIIISLISIIISILITNTDFSYLQIFTARIPSFLMGLCVGYLIINKKRISPLTVYYLYLSLLVGIIFIICQLHNVGDYFKYTAYGFIWYPLILTTLPLCLLLTKVFDILPTYIFSSILTFWGTYSLTIYLYHEKILFLLTYHTKMNGLILNILAIAVTIVAAYITSNIITFLTNKYSRIKIYN
ncbi:peptidoglycan/LPS O-acetylase OafA/YrhL [Dysgonomonas alginatilytica]|uniref:Peptidoglycan/LPS O-acetylase OafA/YrhL n=1 Tax=Dysgonomonas alginatilytica TaxID=1605892 RepID=A0A2V3PX06_9BACT|nr:peptidoglycan/LPS O-acetylase OafA/YrhL [Dysgonomonas alginatilytica]